jgi:hypothetical protein
MLKNRWGAVVSLNLAIGALLATARSQNIDEDRTTTITLFIARSPRSVVELAISWARLRIRLGLGINNRRTDSGIALA